MSTLFAALSALAYGAADFSGGRATRAHNVLGVLVLSQTIGLGGIVAIAVALRHPLPTAVDMLWGVAAGLSGVFGLSFLYRGLASGSAAIVSPTAALVGTGAPIVAGVLLGESPALVAWVGVGVAVPAILLLSLSRESTRRFDSSSLGLGIAAGLGFGGYFILIDRTSAASGFWPLASARLASIAVVAIVAGFSRRSLLVARRARGAASLAGALDMAANAFFLLAVRAGLLVTSSVVSSLYPAPTVVLARLIDGERLGPRRAAGLVAALVGVALMAL